MLDVKTHMETYRLLQNKVLAYAQLSDGWDGSGGKAPNDLVINQAHLWLNLCSMYPKIKPPHVSCAGDNEINLEWSINIPPNIPCARHKPCCIISIRHMHVFHMSIDYLKNRQFSELKWLSAKTTKEQFHPMYQLLSYKISNLTPTQKEAKPA